MIKRGMVLAAVALAAGWSIQASAGVIVKTTTPERTKNFWIVKPQDLQRQLAITYPNQPNITDAQLRIVLERFGQWPINDLPLPTKANVQYLVFAQCNGLPRRPPARAVGHQPSVTVSC